MSTVLVQWSCRLQLDASVTIVSVFAFPLVASEAGERCWWHHSFATVPVCCRRRRCRWHGLRRRCRHGAIVIANQHQKEQRQAKENAHGREAVRHGNARFVQDGKDRGRQPRQNLARQNVQSHELRLLTRRHERHERGRVHGCLPAQTAAPEHAKDVNQVLVLRTVQNDCSLDHQLRNTVEPEEKRDTTPRKIDIICVRCMNGK